MNAVEQKILEKLSDLSGALDSLNSRISAVESGARIVASSQAAEEPGAKTRKKTETAPPLPDNVHPKYRTPVEPNTRKYPDSKPGLMLCHAEGKGANDEVYALRALMLLPQSTVAEYFGSRSSSAGKHGDAEYLTGKPLYHLAVMVDAIGGKFYREPAPGTPDAAKEITCKEFLLALAESIARVCNAPSVATYWRDKLAGPAATATKKGKAKA